MPWWGVWVFVTMAGVAVYVVLPPPPPSPAPNRPVSESRRSASVSRFCVSSPLGRDGEAIFRASLVKGMGQEVIVSDPPARSHYREGDTITNLAMNHVYPRGRESHRLLAFTIVPETR